MSVDELLPEAYSAKSSEYQKGTDTMDVWFDSGMDRKIVITIFILTTNVVLVANKHIFLLFV